MKVYVVRSVDKDEPELDWYEGTYRKRVKAEKKAEKIRKKHSHLHVFVIARKVK